MAISNHRLLSFKDGKVTFSWKDYRRGNQPSLMTLSTDEFIRRFLLHVLPRGFQRIRQFGLLANRRRREQLERCRQLLGTTVHVTEPLPADYKSLYQTVTGESLQHCPACRTGNMKFAALLGLLVAAPYASVVAPPVIDSS